MLLEQLKCKKYYKAFFINVHIASKCS